MEDFAMQHLLVRPGPARPDAGPPNTLWAGAARLLRPGLLLLGLAVPIVGCASPSLMPREQALAIRNRDRALSPHTEAIQEVIRQSGHVGALAFLDGTDGHLVVLPGDGPTDAWGRHAASLPAQGSTGGVAVPPVVSFVYRADIPKAPETVSSVLLRQQREEWHAADARAQALRTSLGALADEQRRTAEARATMTAQIDRLQDELASSVATKADMQKAIAAVREEMQTATRSLAEDVAAARKFLLQTAQLGWLNHELNTENANGIRKVSTASQELVSNSARLADTIRQLSDNLASQLKELAERLDGIQNKINAIK
jgi:hypothetical protein